MLRGGRKREELIKPIGVGIFCSAQKVATCRSGVGLFVGSGRKVVGVGRFVVLVKHASASSVQSTAGIEVTFVFHLAIYRHRLLRIEQIEICIPRFEANGVLCAVIH